MTTAATPSNQNVEAYNALLQGNFYNNRNTAEDTRKAIGYYEEAIRLDPRYALAYAKLSVAARNLTTGYGSIAAEEIKDATAKARASAQTALALDPNLAEAHSAQGLVLKDHRVQFRRRRSGIPPRLRARAAQSGRDQQSGQPECRAWQAGRRGRARAPGNCARPIRTQTHFNLAIYLISLSRYDEAEAAMRKAIALEPQSAQNYMWLAVIQMLRGNPAPRWNWPNRKPIPSGARLPWP